MDSEADHLALWCLLLPELRTAARRSGVLDRLDRDADRVKQGGPAKTALKKWGPVGPDGAPRSWADRPALGIAALPGRSRAPGVGAGEYGCPLDRCARVATRDDNGHPPRCAAFDASMRPQ